MNARKLLEILACPACHGDLALHEKDGQPLAFSCPVCQLAFVIDHDIPVMLLDKAAPLSQWLADNPGANQVVLDNLKDQSGE